MENIFRVLVFIYVAYLAAAFLVAVFLIRRSYVHRTQARKLKDIATSKIRSAAQGYVELTGVAKAKNNQPLIAPLTDIACVWYSYQIEERHGASWEIVEQKTSTEHFLLEDETGQCEINPEQADVVTYLSRSWTGHSFYPNKNQREQGWFARWLNQFRPPRYRYYERRLLEGEQLFTTGLYQSTYPPQVEEQIEQLSKETVERWKTDPELLQQRFSVDASRENQDWDVVTQAAIKEATKQVVENYDGAAVDVLQKHPDPSKNFFLSSISEGILVEHFQEKGRTPLLIMLFSGWMTFVNIPAFIFYVWFVLRKIPSEYFFHAFLAFGFVVFFFPLYVVGYYECRAFLQLWKLRKEERRSR